MNLRENKKRYMWVVRGGKKQGSKRCNYILISEIKKYSIKTCKSICMDLTNSLLPAPTESYASSLSLRIKNLHTASH